MNFHGVRYAVDLENDNQYALTFIHGQLADITTYDAAGKVAFPTHDVRRMMDDSLEDGKRLAYEIVFGVNGRMVDKAAFFLDPSTTLPKHHPQGATIAREKHGFIEDDFDDRIKGPSRNPFNDFSNNNLRDRFERPQPRSAEPFDPAGDDGREDAPPPRRNFPGSGGNTSPGNSSPGTSVARKPPVKLSVPDRQLEELLTKFGEDLTDKARQGRLDPVIGREEERTLIKQYLLRKKKASVNLVGESGVGKTELFKAIAQDIVSGDVPEDLKNARVITLDVQGMNEGAKFRGQFEERLLPVLRGLKERDGYFQGKKIILAIDEIHSAFAAGAAEGAANAGQMMLPYLSGEELTCIGATTPDMYKKHIEGKALDRRFQKLTIDSLEDKATKATLRGLGEVYQKHHHLKAPVTDEQIDYIVNLTNRFMTSRKQPDKAIGVMDAAGSIARMENRDEIINRDIARAVAAESKLKAEFLDQSDTERMLTLERELPARVLGQKDATDAVTAAVFAARAGLNDPSKPSGAFVFLGPTGVGKTETAKALAEFLFGSSDDNRFIKVDMGEFGQGFSGQRLTGAPPGFVGFEDDHSIFERVRQNPRCVIVFDEIEKAAPEVFNNLLAILNDGKTTDAKNREIDFTNAYVIMTSNKGSDKVYELLKGGKGFGFETGVRDPAVAAEKERKALEANYEEAKRGLFKPEMINRIEELGGFVIFRPLGEDVAQQLLARELDAVSERLRSNPKGIMLKDASIKVDDTVKKALFEKGFDKMFGARPLKKVVQKYLAQPLSYELLKQKDELAGKNVTIVIDQVDTTNPRNMKFHFEFNKAAEPVATAETKLEAANGNVPAVVDQKKKSGGPKI